MQIEQVKSLDDIRSQIITQATIDTHLADIPLTMETIIEKWDLTASQAKELPKYILEEVNPRLDKQGIPPISTEFKSPHSNQVIPVGEFDPLFILACNAILDPSDTRSKAAKLKELEPLGVTSKKWSTWLDKPENLAYVNKVLDRRYKKHVGLAADLSLARNVEAGDLQSIKYFNEMTDRYKSVDKDTQNIGMILMMVMQILAKHVNQDVIEAVATELENNSIDTIFGELG